MFKLKNIKLKLECNSRIVWPKREKRPYVKQH